MPASVSETIRKAQAEFADRIDDDWALVTVGTQASGWSTMTIGWGSTGVLWRRPILTVFVHPLRFTHHLLLENDYFCVQLFDNKYKRDLAILGSKSGRNGDKVALTSLTPKAIEHGMTFEEATTTFVCKKILTHQLEPSDAPRDFLDRAGDFYATDAHTVFMGEIVEVL